MPEQLLSAFAEIFMLPLVRLYLLMQPQMALFYLVAGQVLALWPEKRPGLFRGPPRSLFVLVLAEYFLVPGLDLHQPVQFFLVFLAVLE
jgi:hypothetical protein